MEFHHPLLESAVIGIDVLDMIDAAYNPLTCCNINRAMCNSHMFGDYLVCGCTIGTYHHILIQKGFEHGFDLLRTHAWQNKISCFAMTVTHYQHGYLFCRRASFCRFTPTLMGYSGQETLPLEGLKKERFVCFDNAAHLGRLLGCRCAQKAMSPFKASVLSDPAIGR